MNQFGENQLQIENPHVIQLACYNKDVNQGSSSELIAKREATSNPVIRLVAYPWNCNCSTCMSAHVRLYKSPILQLICLQYVICLFNVL